MNKPFLLLYKAEVYTKLRFVFLLLLLNVVLPLLAQETKVVSDLHLWTGVQLEKTFAKDWTVSLGEEFRFKHDISEINNYFTELGIRYTINKNFALQGNYRFTRDRKQDQSYENLSRYNFDLRYKGKLDFMTIKYRLRYQKEVEDFKMADQNIPYERYLRHRLTIVPNKVKFVDPYVSGELFQLFMPTRYPRFEYIRLLLGLKYEMDKAGEIKAAFGFNRELGSTQPAMIYVIQLNYTYKL